MVEPPKVKGHFIINVAEASGKNKEDQLVWDPNFVEGFVKVEIRGGAKNVKVQSSPKRVLANSINWQEELVLDVLENATELRLMLCREKRSGTRVGTSVIAACGIFVNDIMDAVPIDKYFELFKPGAGGEGGFIRISMDFVKTLQDRVPKTDGAKAQPVGFKPALSFKGYTPENGSASQSRKTTSSSGKSNSKLPKKKGFPFLKLGIALAAVGLAAWKVVETKNIQIVVKDKDAKDKNDKKTGRKFF
ncbi:hypothetical protein COCOBI_02-6850 [Coccomyxa sp. Obi]|nr:hypothetical protein COCOBI_02-6850 [Coccomyxa sp. Obi]